MKYKFAFTLIISLCFLFQNAYNQQTEKKVRTETEKPAKSSFQMFFEKIYLHLDRSLYASGEDIWFEAYLTNAQSNWFSGTSSSLYVDLISPESKLIDQKVIRLNNGSGSGDFKLRDSIPQGKYRIRAYTNWIRNFGDCFVFEKEIEICSPEGIKPKMKPLMIEADKTDIRFFPEGGALVSDVASMVGFKATDGLGKGCEAKGKIVSSQGDTVGWFESTHLGMGVFSFLPIHGLTYEAVGTMKNRLPFKTALPVPLPKGFVIHINNNDTARMIMTISTNAEMLAEYKDKEMILVGKAFGKNYFTAKVVMSGLQVNVRVPKSYFPAGIASITLYDAGSKAVCERVVYVERKNNVSLSVVPDKKVYRAREEVSLKVKASDSHKQPVKAQFSLSVVDAGQVPDDASDLVSYLMLESEIKGRIEKAKSYFDTTNINRYKQLDLLLLTQGWRNYVWRQLADSGIHIKYMVEPGITLSGKVREKFVNKPLPGANVTMFLSGAKQGKLLFTKADSTGKYYFDGIEFYGSKKVILTTNNQKGKNKGWILRDSLYNKPLNIPLRPIFLQEEQSNGRFLEEAGARKKTMKKYTLADTIALSEVVIAAKSKLNEKQTSEHMMEGGMADYDYKIGPDDLNFVDIGAFFMARVPGAQPAPFDPQMMGDSPNKVAFRSMGEASKPRFVLDNFPVRSDDDDVVYNLSMEQIDRIIISKTDPLSTDNIRNRYVISIFTKSGYDAKKVFYSLSENITGYYQTREFYSPKYTGPRREGDKPDLRTTIYWNPSVETNENGEATVIFYNADKPAQIRVNAEGITSKGVPVGGTMGYEVK